MLRSSSSLTSRSSRGEWDVERQGYVPASRSFRRRLLCLWGVLLVVCVAGVASTLRPKEDAVVVPPEEETQNEELREEEKKSRYEELLETDFGPIARNRSKMQRKRDGRREKAAAKRRHQTTHDARARRAERKRKAKQTKLQRRATRQNRTDTPHAEDNLAASSETTT
mmetsp:Transcript_11934/g.39271  ORF Transcript_11934/g.39271 Transcript_11934/m.39271 type:complete len:168 (+) Transcript_11934:1068-1571(+)